MPEMKQHSTNRTKYILLALVAALAINLLAKSRTRTYFAKDTCVKSEIFCRLSEGSEGVVVVTKVGFPISYTFDNRFQFAQPNTTQTSDITIEDLGLNPIITFLNFTFWFIVFYASLVAYDKHIKGKDSIEQSHELKKSEPNRVKSKRKAK